jgi:hypothetical protein
LKKEEDIPLSVFTMLRPIDLQANITDDKLVKTLDIKKKKLPFWQRCIKKIKNYVYIEYITYLTDGKNITVMEIFYLVEPTLCGVVPSSSVINKRGSTEVK